MASSPSASSPTGAQTPADTTKPFLKWAGNKQRIVWRLNEEFEALSRDHGPLTRLVEPFAGSGAVFLGTDFPGALLSDINEDIINLFCQVQKRGAAFIAAARELFEPKYNTREEFNALRAEFNAIKGKSSAQMKRKAVIFLYLNRHCFNGLCRYNGSGQFNVPFGQYKSPLFPETEIRSFIEKSKRAVFKVQGFESTMADPGIGAGTLVYCDPPYVPLSATSSFSDYAKEGFGEKEQTRLAELAQDLAARGAVVVVSNHDTPFSRKIYSTASRITGFDVKRSISGKGDGRKTAPELLAVYAPTNRLPQVAMSCGHKGSKVISNLTIEEAGQ